MNGILIKKMSNILEKINEHISRKGDKTRKQSRKILKKGKENGYEKNITLERYRVTGKVTRRY